MQSGTAAEDEAAEMEQIKTSDPVTESEPEASVLFEESGTVSPGSGNEELEEIETADFVTEPESESLVEAEQFDTAREKQTVEIEQNEEPSPVLKPIPDAPEQFGEAAQMDQTTRR